MHRVNNKRFDLLSADCPLNCIKFELMKTNRTNAKRNTKCNETTNETLQQMSMRKTNYRNSNIQIRDVFMFSFSVVVVVVIIQMR